VGRARRRRAGFGSGTVDNSGHFKNQQGLAAWSLMAARVFDNSGTVQSTSGTIEFHSGPVTLEDASLTDNVLLDGADVSVATSATATLQDVTLSAGSLGGDGPAMPQARSHGREVQSAVARAACHHVKCHAGFDGD